MEATDEHETELRTIREAIDDLDERLIELFSDRLGLAGEARRLKERAGLPLVDPEREAQIVRRASELARSRRLEPEMVRTIFWRILGLSHWAQERGSTEPPA